MAEPSPQPPEGVEIERKFLVPAFPDAELADAAQTEIRQGYVADTGKGEVRVRERSGDCRLTVKHGTGLERIEREIELPPELFEALWPLTGDRRVEKVRHVLEEGDHVIEVDRYHGRHEGLIVAEVEFGSREAAGAWTPPDWIGREVTGDEAYLNRTLAREGLPDDAT
jgi:adenylate cyclase